VRVTWESGLLTTICMADLVSTLWLVSTGSATEANPILRFYLEQGGNVSFAGAKLLLFLGPLFVLELVRRRHPRLVRALLRVGIVLYLVCYLLGVWHVNATAVL
jgi:hypothetical protein